VGRYQDMLDLAESTLSTQGGRNVEETYLYQGHALLFTGDVEGAVAAYEQALKLNENFYPAQWALDSLDGS
jgi:tetratricopeptide (TPR) repeat protein